MLALARQRRQQESATSTSRARSAAVGLALVVQLVGLAPSSLRAGEWPPLGAAGEAPAAAAEDASSEAIAARRRAAAAEIEQLREELATPRARPGPLRERIELLGGIEDTLALALEARRELERPLEAPPPPPARSATIDALLEAHAELAADQRRIADLEGAVEASRQALAAALAAVEDEERERRRLRRAVEEAVDAEGAQALELARLRARAAREQALLRRIELEGQRRTLELHRQRRAELEQAVLGLRELLRGAAAGPAASGSELDRELAVLESRRLSLRRRVEEAAARLEAIEGEAPTASQPARIEERGALRARRDTARNELAVLAEREQRLRQRETLLGQWLALIRGDVAKAGLEEWEESALAIAEAQARSLVQRQGRLAELGERLDDVEARLELPGQEGAPRRALQDRREELTGLIGFLREDSEQIEELERLAVLVQEEIRSRSPGLEVLEQITSLPGRALRIWRTELTSIDDEPITVGNAVLAVLLLVLGFTVSRKLSARIRAFAEARLQLDAGVAGALQTGTFYLLLISFTLIALRSVNFPLTAFTFAGGALAIGIGFGSQNVMNNFISGLILMLERPVRAHDLVEVEGTHGSVEQIGARSTRIRATDGRHIIVPNSFFLENNVVNWTLSDELIRTRVAVGVVYGSPTRLVIELIERVLAENDRILEQPRPIINFANFGDNSLDFEAHFWLKARTPMVARQVESQVRLRIDDLFREHGLVIAFPQRDVHLDSVSPIQVRLVDSGQGQGDG